MPALRQISRLKPNTSSSKKSHDGLDLGKTSLYRIIQLALAFIVNTATLGILTNNHGVGGYAVYALIGSFLSLLPFADLGLGAGLVNATADWRSGVMLKATYMRILRRTFNTLAMVGTIVVAIDAVVLFSGGWKAAVAPVSDTNGAQIAAAVTILSLAVTLPFGIGMRVLQGMGLMKVVSLLGIAQPFVQAAGIASCFSVNAPAYWFAVVPAATYFLNGILLFVTAWKKTGFGVRAFFKVTRRTSSPTYRIRASAIPFLVISIAMTAAFQLDRILVSQLGTVRQLAEFAIVAQYYAPIYSIVTLAAQNLWPRYRVLISTGAIKKSLLIRHVVVFAGVGAVAAVALAAVVAIVQYFVLDEVIFNQQVMVFACTFLIIMAIHQPSAMLLNDPSGLRIQAMIIVLMSIVNIFLTILFIPISGAAGPYVASCIAVGVFAVIPTLFFAIAKIKNVRTSTDISE